MPDTLRLDLARLKRARLEQALTQEALAQLANVHPVTLARIETGAQNARASTIKALANALGVEILSIAEVA